MAEETQLFTLEKANQIAEKPFKLLSTEPRELFKTNYDWYLHGKGNPMIGRENNGAFEVWKDGGWTAINKNDYWYDVKDKDGKPELKGNGQPRRKFYFDKYFEWQIQFKEPTEVLVYNKEVKANRVETVEFLNLRIKTSLNSRILEYMRDPRNKDTYMEITFDDTKSPVDMYGIRYNSNI